MIKSVTVRLFEEILKNEFKLKSKVEFKKKKIIKFDGDLCFGDYLGEKIKKNKFSHRIRVATSEMNSDFQLFATMAHEYAHAWQIENDLELDHDKKSGFKYWIKHFKNHYQIDIVSMN